MPEAQPLFSVIIPAFNREKFVGAALCSVAAQTFTDWECLVVDDGSTDGTRFSTQMIIGLLKSLAEKEKTKMPDIRLIKQVNGGPGAARNTGAAEAKGKYLAFLDSDDLWMPWTLETYREALEQAGWPEYLAGTLRLFSNEAEVAPWPREPLRIETYPDAAEAFRRAGGFLTDRLNAEDHDLTLRLSNCRGLVAVRAPVTVAYRQHGDQETGSQTKAMAGMMRLVARERAGFYSGGSALAGRRRAIIAAHARPACLTALKAKEFRLAWRLYVATFFWQLAAGRGRFLAAFPLLAVWEHSRKE